MRVNQGAAMSCIPLYSACMTSITIRDVPEPTRDELAARARLSGRSLQEYLLSQLVELAARPDAEAHLATVRDRKRATGTRLDAATILSLRDTERV